MKCTRHKGRHKPEAVFFTRLRDKGERGNKEGGIGCLDSEDMGGKKKGAQKGARRFGQETIFLTTLKNRKGVEKVDKDLNRENRGFSSPGVKGAEEDFRQDQKGG